MNDSRPIGVFDSGLGGLTVVKELMRLMPGEQVIYLGDTARYPYGGRSEETITTFGLQNTRFLTGMDIKMLIVACNTVSAVALSQVQDVAAEIPVISVVQPGAKAAVGRTAEKKIGIIGTRATINNGAYAKAIAAIDPTIDVFSQPCPLFVPLVEEGLFDDDITRLAAGRYLYEMIDHGIDCLILGCTHYPLLLQVISETVGNRVQVLDSAFWAAREALDMLTRLGLRTSAPDKGLAKSTFYVSDMPARFSEIARMFLGHELSVVKKIGLDELAKQG